MNFNTKYKINAYRFLIITALLLSIAIIYYTRYYYLYCKIENSDEMKKEYYNLHYFKNNNNTNNNNNNHDNNNLLNNPLSISEADFNISNYICRNIYRDYSSNLITYYSISKIYKFLEFIESYNKDNFLTNIFLFQKSLKRVSLKTHYFQGILLKLSHLIIQISFLIFIFDLFLNSIFDFIKYLMDKLGNYVFTILAIMYFFILVFGFNILNSYGFTYCKELLEKSLKYVISC